MSKKIFGILCAMFGTFSLFGTNDITQLDKTMRDFGSLFLPNYSSSISITEYMITLEEMRAFAPSNFDSVYVQKTYTQQTDKAKRVFEHTRQQTQHFTKVIGYDTITRTIGAHKYFLAGIIFSTQSPLQEVQEKRRLFAKFVIVGNTLRLWGKVQIMTDLEFYQTELYEIYDDRQSECFNVLVSKGIAYADSNYGFVPYQKKQLWGLQRFNKTIVVPAQFDSLYSFRNGVALVKKGKEYNLLKPDGTYVLSSWNRHIYCTRNDSTYTYWQWQSNNSYTPIELPVAAPTIRKNNQFSEQYFGTKSIISRPIEEPCNPRNFEIFNSQTNSRIAVFNNYDRFERCGDYFFGIQQDTSIVVDTSGTILFSSQHTCKPHVPGYIIVFNRTTRLFGVYCPYTKQYIEPEHWFILPVERDKFFISCNSLCAIQYIQ